MTRNNGSTSFLGEELLQLWMACIFLLELKERRKTSAGMTSAMAKI
jgi:hypothetical protein